MRNGERPTRPLDKDRAARVLKLHQAYKAWDRTVTGILTHRVEFARAADARDLAEFCGYRDSRSIYYQATGEQPLQQRTVFALAVDDPEGARQILAAENEALGYEAPRPSAIVLAQAPTLGEALRAVTDSAACCTESTAMEYAALHDGKLTPDELVQLEEQWAAEDRKREVRRAQLRAMAQDQPAPQIQQLRKGTR